MNPEVFSENQQNKTIKNCKKEHFHAKLSKTAPRNCTLTFLKKNGNKRNKKSIDSITKNDSEITLLLFNFNYTSFKAIT